MKSSEDRRAPNVHRVSLTTLVDICSQQGDGSPFQAESANVSGRGMHVRTSYLPDVGEELVCRLNHDDQEILVEGRVAWRAEGEDSGEFGIQFTALDADSAGLLQNLGEPVASERQVSPIPPDVLDDEAGGAELFSEGSRVKLHIDGLGAPMKACVHEGSSRKLRVGSCLEFLKVGRDLRVEDVGEGESKGATVDAVNVVINPSTSVPELVVQLRYEGISPTPAPVEAKEVAPNFEDEVFSGAPEATEESSEAAAELSEEEAAPWEPAAEALRARLSGAMKSAGSAASKAGGVLGSAAQTARESVAAAAAKRGIASPVGRTRPQTPGSKRRQTTRRTTRRAPAHLRSGIHDVGLAGKHRPQSASRRVAAAPEKPKRRLAPALFFGAAFLVFAGSAYALRTMSPEEEVGEAQEPKTQPEAPKAATAAPPKKAKAEAKKKVPEGGVVAEVPLFGPQAMAVKPAQPDKNVDVAEAEKRSAAAAVKDQTWEESGAQTQEEQATPWGRGRLYLPTIHRIRLDGVGASIAGAVNADGFTVVIPGRKAMESGKPIQKRDKRIVAVSTSNGARGASVKFEFRGAVPPYRVRLRKDFIEFLISAPEDTVARL